MFWIFAAVVLWLAVAHEGFRRVLLWTVAFAAAAFLIIVH